MFIESIASSGCKAKFNITRKIKSLTANKVLYYHRQYNKCGLFNATGIEECDKIKSLTANKILYYHRQYNKCGLFNDTEIEECDKTKIWVC